MGGDELFGGICRLGRRGECGVAYGIRMSDFTPDSNYAIAWRGKHVGVSDL